MRYRDAIRSRFPVSPRLQSDNLPRRYSKAAGSRPIAFRGSKAIRDGLRSKPSPCVAFWSRYYLKSVTFR